MNSIGSDKDKPALISQPLMSPDIEISRALYGVEFKNPENIEVSDFAQVCQLLVQERDRLLATEISRLLPIRPAVFYQPAKFMVDSLTSDQVAAINERETRAVADYCVDVQRRIGKVAICESFEPMRHLPQLFNDSSVDVSFSNIPFPDVASEWAGKPQEFWVRDSFAQRLVVMGKILNKVGIRQHFIEAFRPVGVQEGMFKRRVQRTRNEHPLWDESQVITESQSKTASTPRLASHKGGAAVDLLLEDIETRELLDFGHKYPDGGVLVFPRTPYVTADQWRNRQLLQVTAGLSGLKLYVGEDWHISFGDNLASLDERDNVIPGYVAKFGPIREFDRDSGAVTSAYKQSELDEIFETD